MMTTFSLLGFKLWNRTWWYDPKMQQNVIWNVFLEIKLHYAFIWKKNEIKTAIPARSCGVTIQCQNQLWHAQFFQFTPLFYPIQVPFQTTSQKMGIWRKKHKDYYFLVKTGTINSWWYFRKWWLRIRRIFECWDWMLETWSSIPHGIKLLVWQRQD